MTYEAEDLAKDVQFAPNEPKQSCPIVDAAQKEAASLSRTLSKAARETETGSAANDALNEAESFAESIQGTLETLRGINAGIRERLEVFEKIADRAGESMMAYEERIAELEAHQQADHDIIQNLTARVQRSWWGRLIDHAQAFAWKRRARATAMKNADLRLRVREAEEYAEDCVQGVIAASEFINKMEWETGAFGEKKCPECHASWRGWWATTPPEHDETCEVGTIARRLRWALQGTQESK